MWPGGLPATRTPLWQVTHAPVAFAWSKCTALQLAVVWQSSQEVELGMWFAGRAVSARDPLPPWQATQVRGVPAISPAT